MAAKMILPRFGGSPAVWTTSVLFFQVLLLVGYWLAHRLGKYGFSKITAVFIAVLLGVAFSITRGNVPEFALGNGVLEVVATLAAVIGLPFLVLSTCAPTIQGLFATTSDVRRSSPYFLYAASNLGSLLVLLAYPFLIEPNFSLRAQFAFFKGGLLVLAVLLLFSSVYVRFLAKGSEGAAVPESISLKTRLGWMSLAAVPCEFDARFHFFRDDECRARSLFWVVPLAVYIAHVCDRVFRR